MKTKLIAMALLAAGSMFAETHFSVGINLGGHAPAYYAPVPVQTFVPARPGWDYDWVDGYWAQNHSRRMWVPGSWVRRAYSNRYQANGYRNDDHRFDQNRGRDNDRDRRDQQDFRRGNSYGNGFRDRR